MKPLCSIQGAHIAPEHVIAISPIRWMPRIPGTYYELGYEFDVHFIGSKLTLTFPASDDGTIPSSEEIEIAQGTAQFQHKMFAADVNEIRTKTQS